MDAQDLLEQKLGAYRDLFLKDAFDRDQRAVQPSVADEQLDWDQVVQELDPVLLKSDFDTGLRAIADDFMRSFNEVVGRARESRAIDRTMIDKFIMRTDEKAALISQFQYAAAPTFQALHDFRDRRATFLNFRSSHTQRSVAASNIGSFVGGAVGTIFGPAGALVGAMVGGHLAGSGIDKQGQQLLADYCASAQALSTATAQSWNAIADVIRERFNDYFGTRLQRLQQELNRSHAVRPGRLTAQNTSSLTDGGPSRQAASINRRAWLAVSGFVGLAILITGIFAWPGSSTQAQLQQSSVLRAGPGERFDEKATLPAGTRGTIVDESVPGWTKFRLSDGEEGWIPNPITGSPQN